VRHSSLDGPAVVGVGALCVRGGSADGERGEGGEEDRRARRDGCAPASGRAEGDDSRKEPVGRFLSIEGCVCGRDHPERGPVPICRPSLARSTSGCGVLDGLVRYRFGDNAELMGAWASARNALGPFRSRVQPAAGQGETPSEGPNVVKPAA